MPNGPWSYDPHLDLPLAEGDVGDIDSDGDGIPDGRAVGVTDVDPATGGNHDPVELAVGRWVVDGGAAAQEVDAVVQAAEQPVVVEVVGLLAVMRHDRVRIGDQQGAPRLPVFVPRFGLLGGEVGAGEDKRRDEVVPVGLAGEVAGLELIPRRGTGRRGERRRGVAALGQQHAVGGLDRLPVRLPGRVLAGPPEWADDQSLVAGLAGQHHAVEQPGLALQRPERAGDRGGGAEPFDLLPAPGAAVPVDGQLQQFVHYRRSSGSSGSCLASSVAPWAPRSHRLIPWPAPWPVNRARSGPGYSRPASRRKLT